MIKVVNANNKIMKKPQIEIISLKEHQAILEKMNQYNFEDGFMIGRNDAILKFKKMIRNEADECGMIKEGDLIKQLSQLGDK